MAHTFTPEMISRLQELREYPEYSREDLREIVRLTNISDRRLPPADYIDAAGTPTWDGPTFRNWMAELGNVIQKR